MAWWQRLFTTASRPVVLGRYWSWCGPRTLALSPQELAAHAHVIGRTGSGKSYFLAGLFLGMHRAGMAATLIDPHGDLAGLVLSHLVGRGELTSATDRARLIYLDLPAAAASRRYLPLNYLAQPYDDHTMAELVAEACKRAWPELAHGAPTFENILKHSVIALRQAGEPLSSLSRLLTNRDFRERVLAQTTDEQVLRFFHDRLDAWGRDGPVMKESTLNRADLLTLSPMLRHGLAAHDNALDFRAVLDTGTSLLINLALPSPDARRLLGCLLTVGMESAALSRANIPETARRPHHLVIDEFSQFMAQSEESLTRMLSETRKYNLFCVMAHQNWSQASDRLRGALQNVGLEVILKAGRLDAEYSARLLASVDPLSIKHTVTDADALERTHPTFFPLQEQWEQHIQAIQALKTGEAFIRLPDDSVKRVRTPTLPAVRPDPPVLAALQAYYQDTYFRPFPTSTPPPTSTPSAPPPTRRRPVISRTPPELRSDQTVFHAPEAEPTAGSVPDGPTRPISRKPKP